MERYRDVIDLLPLFAEENGDIDAVVVVGSQSRRETPADKYSDLDLVFFCDAPRTYLDETAWLDRFGEVVCTFTEPTVGGHKERRVLYRDNRDIDITVLPAFDTCRRDLLGNPDIVEIVRTGYRVVYDRTAAVEVAFESTVSVGVKESHPPVSYDDLDRLLSDFNYHIVWAAKKLLRGELLTAVSCINSYLVPRLLRMLSHYHAARNERGYRRYGRFIDANMPEGLREELARCFSRYDREEAYRTLYPLFDFFNRLARSTYDCAGYPFPEIQHVEIRRLLSTLDRTRD